VKVVSVNTNAALLDKRSVDELVDSGVTRFNISINGIDEMHTREISGTSFYSVDKVKETLLYIDSLIKSNKYANLEMTLAPVMMKDINMKDVEDMLVWSREKNLSCRYGIQNFLVYSTGRKPVKMLSFDKFFEILKDWEIKYDLHLILSELDYKIIETRPLPKIANKGEIVHCNVLFEGRRSGELIARYEKLIEEKKRSKHKIEKNHLHDEQKNVLSRLITIYSKESLSKNTSVEITRTKHNIYDGIPVKESKSKLKACRSCKRK
jgi:uncharacterized Fe-S cluster-containing radical SAM superfamily enzyme